MTDLSGQSLGRYHILEPLGEGGRATIKWMKRCYNKIKHFRIITLWQ